MSERTPPPGDFSNRDAVKAWLREQPRELSVAIAARAALRVLPLCVSAFSRLDDPHHIVMLPALRSTATAWLAVIGSSRSDTVRRAAAAASAAASVAASAADAGGAATTSAYAAAADDDAAARAAAACGASFTGAYAVASTDAPGTAARAAAASAAGAADAEYASSLNQSASAVARLPLWRGAAPNWATDRWRDLRERLIAADEGWEVWTDWYEARLRGDPFDPALEEARVLLPEALWEQGPKAINTEIAQLIAAHGTKRGAAALAPAPPPQLDIAALLAVPNLRIALAEFEYDRLAKLMRMAPFPGDLSGAEDRAALERDLAALALDARDVARLAGRDGSNLHRDFVGDADRYADEASRGSQGLLARRLWGLGEDLHHWKLDDDLRAQLPRNVGRKLDRLVDSHFDLMRGFFAAALARLRDVDKVELAEGVGPEALIAPLRQVRASLDGEWPDAPNMTPEAKAVFESQLQELDRLVKAQRAASNPERASELRQDAERKGKIAVATAARFGVRTAERAQRALGVAADLRTLWPRDYDEAIGTLAKLFKDFPWLG